MKLWGRTKEAGRADDIIRCSFCNKSQRDVRKIIAGPRVYICDECVEICNGVISESLEPKLGEKPPATASQEGALPCAVCRIPLEAKHRISLGMWGVVCQRCAEDVRDALARWPHGSSTGAVG